MEPATIDLDLYRQVLDLPRGKRGVYDDPAALERLRVHLVEYHGVRGKKTEELQQQQFVEGGR